MLDQNHIREKVYLVLDNHSVHHSLVMKEYYAPFHVMFLPSYSSYLNPQERVWSVCKLELAKYFAREQPNVKNQMQYEGEVDYCLSQIARKYRGHNFIMSMRKDLLKFLE